jgi:hypothetical protein
VFPPVGGGVVNDVRFVGEDRLVAAYYGGVVVFSAQPGRQGLVLEHGVRRPGGRGGGGLGAGKAAALDAAQRRWPTVAPDCHRARLSPRYPPHPGRSQSNILSVAATPDLTWIVGGCMDPTVSGPAARAREQRAPPGVHVATNNKPCNRVPDQVHIWHIQRREASPGPQPGSSAPAALPGPAAAAPPRRAGPGPLGEGTEAPPRRAPLGGPAAAAGGASDEYEEEEDEESEGPVVSVIEGPDGGVLELVELTCGGYSGKVRPQPAGEGSEWHGEEGANRPRAAVARGGAGRRPSPSRSPRGAR